jgi:hypothetical protein
MNEVVTLATKLQEPTAVANQQSHVVTLQLGLTYQLWSDLGSPFLTPVDA